MAAQRVAAVDRALGVLAAFEGEAEPLTLAELAQRTGFYKSTLLRLIASLEAFGYLERTAHGRYHPGASLFRLGCLYQRRNGLAEVALPVLKSLVDAETESPSLHVRYDATQRLCLFRLESRHSTLDRVEAGMLLPLARGAAGKVILAFAEGAGDEFAPIRKSCIAVSYGERDPECAGLACPVFGANGAFWGALSVSGPKARFTRQNVRRMSALVLDGATRLTRGLGGNTQPLAAAAARRPVATTAGGRRAA